MQRQHHPGGQPGHRFYGNQYRGNEDPRFGGHDGRSRGGYESSHEQDRDDRGRFAGARDDGRGGYRNNDNAQFGGGYQAGAASGEGASYRGSDWYGGGHGDNRPYAAAYERGERGRSRDDADRGGYGGSSYRDRGGNRDDRSYDDRQRGSYGMSRGSYDERERTGYSDSNDRGYAMSRERFGGDDGRSRGGYESSHEQGRDDRGRFSGRDDRSGYSGHGYGGYDRGDGDGGYRGPTSYGDPSDAGYDRRGYGGGRDNDDGDNGRGRDDDRYGRR
jgi:hypothetical protein